MTSFLEILHQTETWDQLGLDNPAPSLFGLDRAFRDAGIHTTSLQRFIRYGKVMNKTEQELSNVDSDLRQALHTVLKQAAQMEELKIQLDLMIKMNKDFWTLRRAFDDVREALNGIVQSVELGHHETYREQIRLLAAAASEIMDLRDPEPSKEDEDAG